MAYDADKGKVGQNWVWYVEIEPRTCDNVYGVNPCTASGAQCAYSWATCEDLPNFVLTNRTFKFSSKEGEKVFAGTAVMPTLERVSDIPTEIDPKKSTTINARMSLTFQDVKDPPPMDSDKGAGKYYTYRDATFWRIFTRIYRESYKYCTMRIYEGLASYTSINDFKLKRELLVNNIEFMSSGKVRVTGTDKTRTTKGIKIPNAISSSNVLTQAITGASSIAYITDGTEYKMKADSSASYMKVIDETNGDEYIQFVSIVDDSLTLALGGGRGLFGTSAVDHAIGCKVIQVAVFADVADTGIAADTGVNPVDAIKTILEGWVEIDAGDIDGTQFDTERDDWYLQWKVRRIIESPVQADKLISQLNQMMLSNVWQDENEKLTFKGLTPVAPGDTRVEFKTSENVLDDSLRIDNKTETMVSRVTVHFEPNDTWGLKDHKNEDDFSQHLIWINAAAENPNGMGSEPVEIEFFVDWIYTISEAKGFASRYIRRFSPIAPAEIEFEVYRRDSDTETGDIIDFTSNFFVEDDGSDDTINIQILSKKENQSGIIKMKALETRFALKYAFITPSPSGGWPDWTASTDEEKLYGYICDQNSAGDEFFMSDGAGASYIW